jgi:hypothetical protein
MFSEPCASFSGHSSPCRAGPLLTFRERTLARTGRFGALRLWQLETRPGFLFDKNKYETRSFAWQENVARHPELPEPVKGGR